jgi:hypothetical protein
MTIRCVEGSYHSVGEVERARSAQVGGSRNIEATECVTADLRLRTKAGELITQRQKCLVWNVPMMRSSWEVIC